jgi:predicted Zn-dependent protease
VLNRRLLLQATGAGAALAWLGCGGGDRRPSAPVAPRPEPERVRAQLRDAVAQLCSIYAHASALAVVHSHVAAAVDSTAQGSRRQTGATLVLSARDRAGRRVERVTRDLAEASIAAEVSMLLGGKPARAARVDFGAPVDAAGTRGPGRDGAAAIGELAARVEAAGSSRLVYRGAYVESDDADVLVVAPGCDRRQRRQQSRSGVVLAAWRGAELVAGEASRAVAGSIDAALLDAPAIRAAATSALELVTPGAPPAGPGIVVLDPGVVAAIAEVAIADLMTAPAWLAGAAPARQRGERVGSPLVTIADDPRLSAAAYGFDDEGVVAAPAALIEGGVVGAPLADAVSALRLGVPVTSHARRPGHGGPLAATPCHVAVSAGTTSVDAMIGGVDGGLLLEGALAVRVDPESWEVVVRVARARRIAGGALTGHVHPDLELRATVPLLLASVTAVSDVVVTAGRRVVGDGGHLWRAATAPWWLARATVVPGRRRV